MRCADYDCRLCLAVWLVLLRAMRLMDPTMSSRKVVQVAVHSPGGHWGRYRLIGESHVMHLHQQFYHIYGRIYGPTISPRQKAKIRETPVEVVTAHRTGSVSYTDAGVVLRRSELAVLAPYRNARVGEIEMKRKSTPS
ncbi:hypothetical protein EDB83DRAFT_608492 [Lactarius deliciosus]|nr:hypothetical protein EDB83DRAFT_608492 [Lactarius deliciosus]